MDQIQDIANAIRQSEANINSAIRSVRAASRRPPGMVEELSCMAKEHQRLVNSFNTTVSGDLSSLLLLIGIGGAAVVSALGAWALKHRYDTQEIKERADLIDKLIEQGVPAEDAARKAMGQYSPMAEAISKATVFVVVLAGIYLIYKIL